MNEIDGNDTVAMAIRPKSGLTNQSRSSGTRVIPITNGLIRITCQSVINKYDHRQRWLNQNKEKLLPIDL